MTEAQKMEAALKRAVCRCTVVAQFGEHECPNAGIAHTAYVGIAPLIAALEHERDRFAFKAQQFEERVSAADLMSINAVNERNAIARTLEAERAAREAAGKDVARLDFLLSGADNVMLSVDVPGLGWQGVDTRDHIDAAMARSPEREGE